VHINNANKPTQVRIAQNMGTTAPLEATHTHFDNDEETKK